jgi:hypothetical protein
MVTDKRDLHGRVGISGIMVSGAGARAMPFLLRKAALIFFREIGVSALSLKDLRRGRLRLVTGMSDA